jgi:hypothetical protein
MGRQVTLSPSPLDWPLDWREWWEEIAARIEYDGRGCPRAEAERLAEREVRRMAGDRVIYPARGLP